LIRKGLNLDAMLIIVSTILNLPLTKINNFSFQDVIFSQPFKPLLTISINYVTY
jgi:hypothetical protein